MTRLVRCAVVVVFAACTGALPCAQALAQSRFFDESLLLGLHRGGADWMPENTLRTFREAHRRWPHALLELDVRLTADGVPVLMHDETVDRTTDGAGPVSGFTLAEVRALDAGHDFTRDGETYPYRGQGYRVATLEEVLAALPEARFLVEPKSQPGIVDAVLEVIERTGSADRVLLASFEPADMRALRARAPHIATAYSMDTGLELMAALRQGDWAAYEPKHEVLSLMRRHVDQFKLTPAEIRRIRDKGIVFQIHTLNTEEEMRHYLDLGVDSILTDEPELLAKVLAEYEEGGE